MIRKLVLFLVGFCMYITLEVCFRGYSFPLMGLCGGMCTLIIDSINDKISWEIDLLIQGLMGSAVITSFELIIGLLMNAGFINRMWDYSDMLFNYKGIICVEFSALWVLLSIAVIFIADAINYYVFDEYQVPKYNILGVVTLKFKEKA